VVASVDAHARARSAWNHSATHLMHAALRRVLGDHVQQKGSLVDPDRTRFDFSHPQPMTDIEIRTVESLVNRAIRANYPVEARLMKYDEAIRSGAMALFGEKYGDEVRVLSMGDFSTELCGGTHVARTGDIGFFKIVSESGVAAGIRRVEAVTAEGALAYTHETEAKLNEAARVLARRSTSPPNPADAGQRARRSGRSRTRRRQARVCFVAPRPSGRSQRSWRTDPRGPAAQIYALFCARNPVSQGGLSPPPSCLPERGG
jgi:alanyl-tRNA synthetase